MMLFSIKGKRSFSNLGKLIVPCPIFIRFDKLLNFGELQIDILRFFFSTFVTTPHPTPQIILLVLK